MTDGGEATTSRRSLPAVGIALPVDQGATVRELRALAVRAEEAGFDVVTVGEVAGVELFSTLAAIATATSRIRMIGAVLPVVSRAPVLGAMGIASIADLSDGRFSIGLGASSPTMARWHERSPGAPIEGLERYVGAVRSALAGEPLAPDGAVPFRLQRPPVSVPVLVAAIGPKALALAGRIADGALLSLCPTAELSARIGVVTSARAVAARGGRAFEIVATGIPVAIGTGDDRLSVRRYLLPYAMATSHRPGFRTAVPSVDDVAEIWERGDRVGALERFDDAVVDCFGATSADGAVARCIADGEAGADTVVLNPLRGDGATDGAAVSRAIDLIGEAVERVRAATAQVRSTTR